METSIRGSLQMMCRAMNGGWKAMSEALGMSQPALKNRVYELKGQHLSVNVAMEMQKLSNTTYFAEAVARASGGTFISLPPIGDICNSDIKEKFVELAERFGELAREWREATADGYVDRHERKTLELIAGEICQLVTQINLLTVRIFGEDTSNGN